MSYDDDDDCGSDTDEDEKAILIMKLVVRMMQMIGIVFHYCSVIRRSWFGHLMVHSAHKHEVRTQNPCSCSRDSLYASGKAGTHGATLRAFNTARSTPVSPCVHL